MSNYKQFSFEDRKKIYFYLELGWSIKKMAGALDKHRSAIYREIKRNSFKDKYVGSVANTLALKRKKASRRNKIDEDLELQSYILERLKEGWSPQQIAGRLKLLKKRFYICHESIYRYIYSNVQKDWYQYLLYKQKDRKRRYGRCKRTVRYEGAKSIHERSTEANSGKEFGHWEGDTIAFNRARRMSITTLVERKTLYSLLSKNNTKASEAVMGKIRMLIERSSDKQWKTLTFDQGGEFADFRRIERSKKCLVYYCDVQAPWQRGCNENTNKRLRRDLPRDLDIENFTEEELMELNKKMNETPRKKLGYLMPKEALELELKNICRT